jgi:hypothetical protein
MSRTPRIPPAPMTRQEYLRRHADACVKADVVPGPCLPCDEAANWEEARMESAGDGEIQESPLRKTA